MDKEKAKKVLNFIIKDFIKFKSDQFNDLIKSIKEAECECKGCLGMIAGILQAKTLLEFDLESDIFTDLKPDIEFTYD